MKMSILEIEYKNIRKISELKLSFVKKDGTVIKNSFIMMANGTGKTTTMTLITGLLGKEAESWSPHKIRSFAPTTVTADCGEFSMTVKFDEKEYKYFLILNYEKETASIETLALPKGREAGLGLPEAIKDIFKPSFVHRFVFDGEQAAKSMDSSSNEAEQTIKYLYRLDVLDEIIVINQKLLTDIQTAEGKKGSLSSLSNLRTRQMQVEEKIRKLKECRAYLNKKIKECEDEKEKKEKQREELYRTYAQLNQEKNLIVNEQTENSNKIEFQIAEIVRLIKTPCLLNEKIYARMYDLGNSMTKLKLPKTISKDFFVELAHEKTCVCDRCIGEKEKEAILKNADRYLGSDQQSVLNTIKSYLMNSSYDYQLNEAFKSLCDLQVYANKLRTRYNNNEQDLLEAGGEEAEKIKEQIDELTKKIGGLNSRLQLIESKDEADEQLTEENNLHRAETKYKKYTEEIAAATRTNSALRKKEIVEALVQNIRERATTELKKEIIRKTNEKIKNVIPDDDIEIENIDRYIKLKGRSGASEGQTLSIAYCFLGTLFEDSELEFPFVIDSPTGKMDLDKRQAVADIIPVVFNQLIAFVQSAEVERFADRFYDNPDTQYFTIISSKQDKNVKIHEGKDFFDSYQRKHKEGEQ